MESKPRVSLNFEVEKVIGVSSDGNNRSYQVRWAPAWVSSLHLVGCEALIEEFLQKQYQQEYQLQISDEGIVLQNAKLSGSDHCGTGKKTDFEEAEKAKLSGNVHFDTSKKADFKETDRADFKETDKAELSGKKTDFEEIESGRDDNDRLYENVVGYCIELPKACNLSDTADTVTNGLAIHNTKKVNNDSNNNNAKNDYHNDHHNLNSSKNCNNHSSNNENNRNGKNSNANGNDVLCHKKINNDHDYVNLSINKMVKSNRFSKEGSSKGNDSSDFSISHPDKLLKSPNVQVGISSIPANKNTNSCSLDEVRILEGRHPESDRKIYTCSFCGKFSFTKREIEKHIQRIHNRHFKPYVCDICSTAFGKYNYLSEHLRKVHGQKILPCVICSEKFIKISDLKDHYQTHHAHVSKPFVCRICQKAFKWKNSLQRHLPVHDPLLPHACDFCDKRYLRRVRLREHLRVAHCGLTQSNVSARKASEKTIDNNDVSNKSTALDTSHSLDRTIMSSNVEMPDP